MSEDEEATKAAEDNASFEGLLERLEEVEARVAELEAQLRAKRANAAALFSILPVRRDASGRAH